MDQKTDLTTCSETKSQLYAYELEKLGGSLARVTMQYRMSKSGLFNDRPYSKERLMPSRPAHSSCGCADITYESGYHYMRDLYVMYIIILWYMHAYESPRISLKSYLFIFTLKDDIIEVAVSVKAVRNANFVSEEMQCCLPILTEHCRVHMSRDYCNVSFPSGLVHYI
jgi:hypothetical protein